MSNLPPFTGIVEIDALIYAVMALIASMAFFGAMGSSDE